MSADIQADVEDGQLQYFYLLAFVLQGNVLFIALKSDLWCAFGTCKNVCLSDRGKMILHDVACQAELALQL